MFVVVVRKRPWHITTATKTTIIAAATTTTMTALAQAFYGPVVSTREKMTSSLSSTRS